MATILDYLDWRGDLSFSVDPFNEVDNLILAELTFFDFQLLQHPATLEKAAEVAKEHPHIEDFGVLFPSDFSVLLEKCGKSPRFSSIGISDYIACLDERKEEQFAALTFHLPDGSLYVGFRGTDDTLVGWKESFNLSFLEEIPSQRSALAYLQRIAQQYPSLPLRVGGHSKGGNLAMYSVLYAEPEVLERVIQVYNNDGPGFSHTLDHPLSRLEPLLCMIVPESSVVGMLLHHSESYSVVKSSNQALFQHDGFSWQVLGTEFVRVDELDRHSRITEHTLQELVHELDDNQLATFTEALYGVLSSPECKTLSDVKESGLKGALSMVKTMTTLDAPTHRVLLESLGIVLRGSVLGWWKTLGKNNEENKS